MAGVQGLLNRPTVGVNKILYDKVFKTFVIIEAGLGQPVAQGRITDAHGRPIANAYVQLAASNVGYGALTDANGTYTIRTAQGESLPAGTYQITCGTVRQSVAIGRGMAQVNLNRVDATAAQQLAFDVGQEQE
jgi:hypothetical protein